MFGSNTPLIERLFGDLHEIFLDIVEQSLF